MRFRPLTVADLPAAQALHATGATQGVLADWPAAKLGMALFGELVRPGSPLVAIVAVLGAKVQGRQFVGGRPKGFVLGWRVPTGLGTGLACQVELVCTSPAHPSWRGHPMAALLLRAVASATGLPLVGLSPTVGALPPADDAAQLSSRPADGPRRHRAVVRGDGGGVAAPIPLAH